jgi:hypothetical protein
MKIIEKPCDLHQLRELSREGSLRVAGVVAVPWHELVGRDRDALEEDLARRLTGSKYGLADTGIKLVGCLGQELLMEVSGDVSMLLEDYALIIAEEAREERDARTA